MSNVAGGGAGGVGTARNYGGPPGGALIRAFRPYLSPGKAAVTTLDGVPITPGEIAET